MLRRYILPGVSLVVAALLTAVIADKAAKVNHISTCVVRMTLPVTAGAGSGYFDLNEAIAEFNGRLGPITLTKLLWRLKIAGVGSTRVPLMGVKKKFRNHPLMGAGLAMMAIDQLRQNGKRLGKTSAELGWILEDNKATNNIIRSVGGVHYKTHRLYEKALG